MSTYRLGIFSSDPNGFKIRQLNYSKCVSYRTENEDIRTSTDGWCKLAIVLMTIPGCVSIRYCRHLYKIDIQRDKKSRKDAYRTILFQGEMSSITFYGRKWNLKCYQFTTHLTYVGRIVIIHFIPFQKYTFMSINSSLAWKEIGELAFSPLYSTWI